MSVWLPPAHPLVSEVLVPMTDDIKTATDGRVSVRVLAVPLAPPSGQFDLVANGIAYCNGRAELYAWPFPHLRTG